MIINEPEMIDPEPRPSQKNWLYIFSPCVILEIITLAWMIYCYLDAEFGRGGWIILGVIMGAIILVMMLVIDLIIKAIVGKKARQVWINETWVIPLAFILFYLCAGTS